jgi:hypothetical protein
LGPHGEFTGECLDENHIKYAGFDTTHSDNISPCGLTYIHSPYYDTLENHNFIVKNLTKMVQILKIINNRRYFYYKNNILFNVYLQTNIKYVNLSQ